MRKGLSAREFARRDGCAESLVRRRIKSGHLVALKDGSIDPKLVGTDWRKSARSGAHTPAHSAHSDASGVRTPDAPSTGDSATVHAPHSRSEAERIRENVRAEREAVELEVMKRNLVNRSEAERAIFGRARAERDAWLNWPLRIGSDMAAALGVTEAALLPILKSMVHEHLAQLAETPDLRLAPQDETDD